MNHEFRVFMPPCLRDVLLEIRNARGGSEEVGMAEIFGGPVLLLLAHSPFGQVQRAIRENEPRVISLGYRVDRYKLQASVISATLTGLAGATKAVVVQLASLTDVSWLMSGEVVLMTPLGGMGTVFGPGIGVVIVISLQNYLSGFASYVPIVIGVIFVVCVLAFRRGVLSEASHLCKRFSNR